MGNTLICGNGGTPSLHELFHNSAPLAATRKGATRAMFAWKFAVNNLEYGADKTSCTPVDIGSFKGFSSHEAYLVAILWLDDQPADAQSSSGSTRKVSSLVTSSVNKLTANSLSAPLCTSESQQGCAIRCQGKFQSGSQPNFSLYCARGRRCDDSVAAVALARSFELFQRVEEGETDLSQLMARADTPACSVFTLDLDWDASVLTSNGLFYDAMFLSKTSGPRGQMMQSSYELFSSPELRAALLAAAPNAKALRIGLAGASSSGSGSGSGSGAKAIETADISGGLLSEFDGDDGGPEPDPNEQPPPDDARFQERIRFFDVRLSEVTPNLYLGSATGSRKRVWLKKRGVTHILNCAAMILKCYYPDDFNYKSFYLLDGKREDILCTAYNALEWMDNAISNGGKVFVHCQQGVSRSTTMCLLYLMWKRREGYRSLHLMVKAVRRVAEPNPGFIVQLILWERRILSPLQKSRLQMMAAQSSYQPDFIVPKMISVMNPMTLLTNKVYILNSKERMWIWTGATSTAADLAAAREHIPLIQKFEGAVSTVRETAEKSEPEEFWQDMYDGTPKQAEKKVVAAPRRAAATGSAYSQEKRRSGASRPQPAKPAMMKLNLGGMGFTPSGKKSPQKQLMGGGLSLKLGALKIMSPPGSPEGSSSSMSSSEPSSDGSRTSSSSSDDSSSSDGSTSSSCSSSESSSESDSAEESEEDEERGGGPSKLNLALPRLGSAEMDIRGALSGTSAHNRQASDQRIIVSPRPVEAEHFPQVSPCDNPKMGRVLGWLYLSVELSILDSNALKQQSITSALNVAGSLINSKAVKISTKTFYISPEDEDLLPLVFQILQRLNAIHMSEAGERVLVQGHPDIAGVAPAVVLMYLMWQFHQPLDSCLSYLRGVFPDAQLSPAMNAQLTSWESRLSGASKLRMYLIDKQSARAPTLMVPRMCPNPGKVLLKPKMVYIIHSSEGLWVWLGRSFKFSLKAAAHKIAEQMREFEAITHHIVEVSQGKESKDFWAVFN